MFISKYAVVVITAPTKEDGYELVVSVACGTHYFSKGTSV
jgi:hypothetical protein